MSSNDAMVKADSLDLDDRLADDAIILRLSFQLDWIYAVAVKEGRLVRRRYRYGQQVAVHPACAATRLAEST